MKNPARTIKLNQGDLVLQEIYRIKDELSASYGHDVHRMFEQIRKHEQISRAAGWKFAPLPEGRKTKRTHEENSYLLHDKPTKRTAT